MNVAVQAGGITKSRTVDPISDFDLGGFLDIFTISGSREEGIAAAR